MKLLLRRRDTEALLEGRPLRDDTGLGDVEAFLSDLRVEFGATPAPAPRPTLAATLEGRRPLRPASGPVPKPTFPPSGPRVHLRLRPIAALLATGAVLFGGLATAGALPAPLQRTTAELSSHLGVHLPGAPPARGIHDRSGHGHSKAPGRSSDHHPTTGTTSPGSAPTTLPSVPTPAATSLPSLPTAPTVPTLPPPPGTLLPEVPSIPGLIWPITQGGVPTKPRVP